MRLDKYEVRLCLRFEISDRATGLTDGRAMRRDVAARTRFVPGRGDAVWILMSKTKCAASRLKPKPNGD